MTLSGTNPLEEFSEGSWALGKWEMEDQLGGERPCSSPKCRVPDTCDSSQEKGSQLLPACRWGQVHVPLAPQTHTPNTYTPHTHFQAVTCGGSVTPKAP